MNPVYDIVTERIINHLDQGQIPWRKPWKLRMGHHCNYVSRKPYQGINALMTGTSGFGCPYWVTFRQAQELGGNVKKGEKSTVILFWKFVPKVDELGQPVLDKQGKPVMKPFERYSNAFNLEQTEGIPIPDQQPVQTPDEGLLQAREMAAKAPVSPIQHGGDAAFWSPIQDFIQMPPKGAFSSEEHYHHILFHEMGHSTGHASRLNRPECQPGNISFGKEPYAREELVAELTASFLSNQCGIMDRVGLDQPTGYIQNWIKVLNDDKTLIVRAASHAQKAANWINGITVDQSQTVEPTGLEPTGLGPTVPDVAPRQMTPFPREVTPSPGDRLTSRKGVRL